MLQLRPLLFLFFSLQSYFISFFLPFNVLKGGLLNPMWLTLIKTNHLSGIGLLIRMQLSTCQQGSLQNIWNMTGPTYLSIFKTGRWVSYEHALKFTISECLQDIEQSLLLCSIVFSPASWPARSKTRVSSFNRVIRLVGLIFFYINQNDVVLVKKKS